MPSHYMRATGYLGQDQAAQTPPYLFDVLHAEFDFDFDPCPVDPQFDGLDPALAWGQRNFVNPPYKDIKSWLAKALAEVARGKLCVFLVPFRPSTQYFAQSVFPHANEVRLLTKKVTFQGYAKPAPFAVCVLVFRGTSVARGVPVTPAPVPLDCRCVSIQVPGPAGVGEALRLCEDNVALNGLAPFDVSWRDAPEEAARAETPWGRVNFVCIRKSVSAFLARARREAAAGNVVYLVLPVRTEAVYFVPQIMGGGFDQIWFLRPNLTCDGFAHKSPMGSMVVVAGARRPPEAQTMPAFSSWAIQAPGASARRRLAVGAPREATGAPQEAPEPDAHEAAQPTALRQHL